MKFNFGQFLEKWLQRHLVTLHWMKIFLIWDISVCVPSLKIRFKVCGVIVSRFCFVQISSGPGSSPGQSDHLQSLAHHNFALTLFQMGSGNLIPNRGYFISRNNFSHPETVGRCYEAKNYFYLTYLMFSCPSTLKQHSLSYSLDHTGCWKMVAKGKIFHLKIGLNIKILDT